jgi:NAD(P)-dependent dehydrogenase (short-subunit alcohol dehydrogenase family)
MDLGLQGKVAVVTGGSEGIGRATARSLGREGVAVIICARRADVLDRAAQDVAEDTGAQIVPVPADVTQPDQVERVIQTAVDRFGRLDILVNNAGTSRTGAFEALDDQTWQGDLELKLFGAIRASRAAIPHLRAAGGGSRRAGADQGPVQGVRRRPHPRQRHPDRPHQERPARAALAGGRRPGQPRGLLRRAGPQRPDPARPRRRGRRGRRPDRLPELAPRCLHHRRRHQHGRRHLPRRLARPATQHRCRGRSVA